MAEHYMIPLRGKRLRVTGLDSCGRVPAGGTADSFIVTKGFISINLSSEVEDGTEITQLLADGSLCVSEKGSSTFKRFNVEIQFCGVHPSLLSFVSNAEPYEDYAGDVAGFTVAEGALEKAFALELWTGLSGTACASGSEEASGYIVLPFVQGGVIGNIEITGEAAVNASITGASTKGGNNWGVGPYFVVMDESSDASFLPTALDPLDHLLLIDTALAPPPLAAEPQPMPLAGVTTTTTTV